MPQPADNTALVNALTRTTPDSAWLKSFAAVDRAHFVDRALFASTPTGDWTPRHREDCTPDEWNRLVYGDSPLVTQVDGTDAEDVDSTLAGVPTSSSTSPTLMLHTLNAAELTGTERVLEVGTGTGYSTAVLSHRLGADNVTSIEYDASVSDRASQRLKKAGFHPRLVTGDGLDGHLPGAPYDAIIATCAVRSIPSAWLWQLDACASITATLSGWMMASGLVHLRLDGRGDAHGYFSSQRASYMLARPHERPPRGTLMRRHGAVRDTHIDPALLTKWTPRFVAQLGAPSAELVHIGSDPVLIDVATGSQAWTEAVPGGVRVHQSGPLQLWDQVEDALTQWQDVGSPDQSAFGLSVLGAEQRVWIGEPDGKFWRLPL